MTHCVFTQNIKATPEQQKRISEIFTPGYVIQSSKAISIMIEQDSVIKARDKQIKELLNKIDALNTEHKNTLIEIAKQNNIAKKSSKGIDSISKAQLEDLRPDLFSRIFSKTTFTKLHGYVGAEVPNFTDFGTTLLNAEVMFEFKRLHAGVKGQLVTQQNNSDSANGLSELNSNQSGLFLKVRYKIF